MRILVTGSSGFVGASVVSHLLRDPSHEVVATSRRGFSKEASAVEVVAGYPLAPETVWRPVLDGVNAVVHLAARVHVMQDKALDPLAEFRRVNAAGSVRLVQQALAAGVQRFVYVSTVKVNGASTRPGRAFMADDTPAPTDAYAISKLEAEQALTNICALGGMELVIVRPPLVYGPGVRANFRSMMHCLYRGIPLPCGSIHNQRSLIALDNLSDLIVTCTRHPAAAGQTFLAADGEDVSTTQLLERLAVALGRSARLFPVPTALLRAGLTLLGKQEIEQRLCGWLQVDIAKTREMLDWSPPVSLDEGLRRAGRWYLQEVVARDR